MKNVVILTLVLSILSSCQTDQRLSAQYADTRSFFEAEAVRLASQHSALHKVLVFGDSSVTQQLDPVKWQNELRPFIEIDLLKNAYKGRFRADSTARSDETYVVTYTPMDAKTDLKSLSITYTAKDRFICLIKAHYDEDNTLYKATKDLVYYTDSLFTISGSQQVRLGNNLKYTVTGSISEGQ
jgi:hypothetical protein